MAHRTWIGALPLLVFGAIGLTLVFGTANTPPRAPDTLGLLDRPLPALAPSPIPGTEASFSSGDFTGRVVLLNVFASWCPSCRSEHSFLMQLAQSGDVPIYGLNWKDTPGAGKLFLTRDGNPYAATGEDRDGSLGALLGVTGVPETYVISNEGRILYRHLGPITNQIWQDTLRPLIARLEKNT